MVTPRTGRPKGQPPIVFTAEMTDCLLTMRAKGHNFNDIAERLGVSYPVVHRKAKAMGITRRMHRGARSGVMCIQMSLQV